MAESHWIYETNSGSGPLRQGELLSHVKRYVPALEWIDREFAGEPVWHELTYEFCVVVSQDCDLTQAFDRFQTIQRGSAAVDDLPELLLCPAEAAQNMRVRAGLGAKEWKPVRQNANPRYQVIQATTAAFDREGHGVPSLGIDFSRYFSIPTRVLYSQLRCQARRRVVMKSPYFEHISTRFAAYFARVGLPQPHSDDPERVEGT